MKLIKVFILFLFVLTDLRARDKRARELGIPLDGTPGPLNAITDVAGVEVGSYASDTSGDIFIAFSTANPGASNREANQDIIMLPNDQISPLFEATVEATEESIINALLAAKTMVGINNTKIYELPEDRLMEILRKYNRIK